MTWGILYKNLDFWHLNDLANPRGMPMWGGGWMLTLTDHFHSPV